MVEFIIFELKFISRAERYLKKSDTRKLYAAVPILHKQKKSTFEIDKFRKRDALNTWSEICTYADQQLIR